MPVPLALATLALLITAAWRDIAIRTIPDTVCLLLAITGMLARALQGPQAVAVSIGIATLLFVVLLFAYARRLLGGGDVKIIAALALGLSPLDSYRFVVSTAIAGGLLAIAYLMLSRWVPGDTNVKQLSLLGRVITVESRRIRRRGPLPYGVAIAAGGAFVLLHPGSF
jgi:prepilin peptidase CpaA